MWVFGAQYKNKNLISTHTTLLESRKEVIQSANKNISKTCSNLFATADNSDYTGLAVI